MIQKGQTAIEYLFILGAGILFSTIVFIAMVGILDSTEQAIILEGEETITIQLLYPDGVYNPGEIEFSFIPRNNVQIKDCNILHKKQLETNYEIILLTDINNNRVNSHTIELIEEGIYNWNVSCIDQNNNFGMGDQKTFEIKIKGDDDEEIDDDPPTVLLISPDDDDYFQWDDITFTYLPRDNNDIKECTLKVDGSEIETNTNITNNIQNTFTINDNTYSQETHNWNVHCKDYSNNEGQGVPKQFNIIEESTSFCNPAEKPSGIGIWTNDGTPIEENQSWIFVTGEIRSGNCRWGCDPGYMRDGTSNNCKRIPSCSTPWPTLTTGKWRNEGTPISSDQPWQQSSQKLPHGNCRWGCIEGYTISGTSCIVEQPPPHDTCCPAGWTYTPCSTVVNPVCVRYQQITWPYNLIQYTFNNSCEACNYLITIPGQNCWTNGAC
jgi:hypothetical protein